MSNKLMHSKQPILPIIFFLTYSIQSAHCGETKSNSIAIVHSSSVRGKAPGRTGRIKATKKLDPHATKPEKKQPVKSIGVATMSKDGTITLKIRSLGPGPICEDEILYDPSDPHYKSVLTHLGGLRPGEVKPVPPWPDKPETKDEKK